MLLHAIVLFTGLLQLIFQLPNSSLFLLDKPRQSPLLLLKLRIPLTITADICKLLFQMIYSFLILFKALQFILQKKVLLSRSRQILFMISRSLQQLLLQVFIHMPQLVHLSYPHCLHSSIMTILLFKLLQLLQSFLRFQQLSFAFLYQISLLFEFLSQQLVLSIQLSQSCKSMRIIMSLHSVNQSFIDCILYYYNQSMLTTLVKMHDCLNILLLMWRLHEYGHNKFEKSADMRTR